LSVSKNSECREWGIGDGTLLELAVGSLSKSVAVNRTLPSSQGRIVVELAFENVVARIVAITA
jgi:hypothetical protein